MVASSNPEKKTATIQQTTEEGKGAGPRVCKVEGVGRNGKVWWSGGSNEKATKTAIIQPLTRLLFCPGMVSKHSKWKKSVPCARVKDKEVKGPKKMEGFYGSIHKDGVNAGNQTDSINVCAKSTMEGDGVD